MRQRILLIVLGIVVLLAIYTFFLRPKPQVNQRIANARAKAVSKVKETKEKTVDKAKTTVKEAAKTVTQQVKSVVETKKDTVKIEPIGDIGKWGTDPFTRDWVLSEAIKDLQLKAITQSGNKAYALINDQILETGEMIQGKRIVSIENDKVVLEQGERRFTLVLEQQ